MPAISSADSTTPRTPMIAKLTRQIVGSSMASSDPRLIMPGSRKYREMS
jgi:hypothetical protein